MNLFLFLYIIMMVVCGGHMLHALFNATDAERDGFVDDDDTLGILVGTFLIMCLIWPVTYYCWIKDALEGRVKGKSK